MTSHRPSPFLVLASFGLAVVTGCGEPRLPSVAHAPGVAPPAVSLRTDALLAKLESEGHPARVQSRSAEQVLVTFEPPVPVADVESFATSFAHQYGPFLGFGASATRFGRPDNPGEVSIIDMRPQRDSGCRSVSLIFQIGAQDPRLLRAVSRECERYSRPPPSYRSRRLPFTANGAVEVLARCGYWGRGTIASYVGFALDKYGDVYSVASDLSGLFRDPVWERFQDLRAYVRTVAADEVERLMADAELASHAGDLHRTFGEDEAHCEAAYDSGRGFRTVALDETKGAPAARARAWLHAVLRE